MTQLPNSDPRAFIHRRRAGAGLWERATDIWDIVLSGTKIVAALVCAAAVLAAAAVAFVGIWWILNLSLRALGIWS